MSDFGFSDEARGPASAGKDRRRPTPTGVAFTIGLLALVAFGLWAWVARSHVDDLAAWTSLEATFVEMDRDLTPLGHGESPPCHTEPDGVVTRSYPPSTGPQAAAVIGYLTQAGWTAGVPSRPGGGAGGSAGEGKDVLARLTKVSGGRELTILVSGPARDQLVGSVTGRSPGSRVGCLGR